jgi:hypothetical protein
MEKSDVTEADQSAVLFQIVEPGRVDYWWPRVSEWIEAALAASVIRDVPAGHLAQALRDGVSQMLLIADPDAQTLIGAMIFTPEQLHSGERVIAMQACGGERVEDWVGGALRVVCRVAEGAGCTHVLALGRPGWVKYLRPLGVRRRATVFEVPVSGGG